MSKVSFLSTKKNRIKSLAISNSKVIENYVFMTALQLISSLFGILIYPYLIRVLGAESYGLYIFASSITNYFIGFVSFGFSLPAVKFIVTNKDDQQAISRVVSSVFTAKSYLAIISTIVYLPLLFSIHTLRDNWLIFSICFSQIIGEILFPAWYFQALQKMRIVTYIQLAFRILSLPFIFIFIKTPADCWIYALTSTLSVILSGITSVVFLIKKEHIKFRFVSIRSLKTYFKDAMPFFWSSSVGIIKQESVTTIIGTFFGMRDVALYDLANKIIILPRMLTMSINGALFPKIIENAQKSVIKKIIRYETILGLSIIGGVIVFGRWIILILGGTQMLDSYPLAIVLSITVFAWLVVGCYHNFIFIPNYKYYFITRNQIVAFVSFFIFCIPGVLIFQNIFVLAAAYSLSGISEMIYSKYLINKYKLL